MIFKLSLLFLLSPVFVGLAWCDGVPGDPAHGKIIFSQSCAICHADHLGYKNTLITKQGPSLVGILGRRAGSGPDFSYTPALKSSGIIWDAAALERFLNNPSRVVPGTAMPAAMANVLDRRDLIAYLATLRLPSGIIPVAASWPAGPYQNDPGDWRNAHPGAQHHITIADLPAPYSTVSAGNAPQVVAQPADAVLSVPKGFRVRLFASGLTNPRIVRTAPNGDIFIAETRAGRVRVMRAADGADTPSVNQIFVDGLDRPFGIAFYPPGGNPQWIYIANNNSVVRYPYHNGDLTPSGPGQTIVPGLCDSEGGHSTRDIAFSPDGKRLYIQVGSGSNDAQDMGHKNLADIQVWEARHGLGAAWDDETNRADILVTDPEGHGPLRVFAAGIRNGAGIAVDDQGRLWASTNERDGLGDDLVPDYVTHVQEGGFYGWPWYYMGNFEDPRHKGERPDLAGRVTTPDVLFQSHSAPLEMVFYTASQGPAVFPPEYRGDIFVAMHGSWNRSHRTGYKVVSVHLDHGVADGAYEDFMTGFVVDDRRVWGRPVGVAVARDGALLVTDDGAGRIWRIAYKK